MTAQFEWVDLDDGRSVYRRVREEEPRRRSAFPTPMVMNDQCEVKSMVDGKMYTSKAALRRSYREKGYTEVGNETMKPKERTPDRKGISESVGKAMSRVGIPA